MYWIEEGKSVVRRIFDFEIFMLIFCLMEPRWNIWEILDILFHSRGFPIFVVWNSDLKIYHVFSGIKIKFWVVCKNNGWWADSGNSWRKDVRIFCFQHNNQTTQQQKQLCHQRMVTKRWKEQRPCLVYFTNYCSVVIECATALILYRAAITFGR